MNWGDVTYIFCLGGRLLDMNRQFLGHDYYTDVITFDYSDRKAPGSCRAIFSSMWKPLRTMHANTAPRS